MQTKNQMLRIYQSFQFLELRVRSKYDYFKTHQKINNIQNEDAPSAKSKQNHAFMIIINLISHQVL